MRAISKYKPPWVLNAEVLTCIYGGAYFRNFTVSNWEHQNALLRCYTAVKLGPPTRDSIGASLASTSGRDHITNSEVVARAGIVSIHPLFSHGRLRRLGHVYYMDDERVPRKFYTDYRQQQSGTSGAPLCDSAVHGRLRVISKLAQLTQTIRKIDRGLAGDGQ